MTFVDINENDLTKKSKKALASLYTFYLEQDKPSKFTLPLIVHDDGSSLTLEQFKIIFLAFEKKVGKKFAVNLMEGLNSDGSNFYTVRCEEGSDVLHDVRSPLVKEVKREASGKIAERSQQKKNEEEKKLEEIEEKFNQKLLKSISNYVVSKFKVEQKDLNTIEDDLMKIIKSVR
jgi:hypothetical protein